MGGPAYFDLASGYSGIDPIANANKFPDFVYWEIVKTEQHEHTSTITDHPVEAGANVADHYRKDLDRISLEVIVTNQPIDYNDPNGIAAQYGGSIKALDLSQYKVQRPAEAGTVSGGVRISGGIATLISGGQPNPLAQTAQTLQFARSFERLQDVHTLLEQLRTTAFIFSVVTRAAYYGGMVIEKWSMSRDAGMGSAATIKMDLKAIRIVETQAVSVPTPVQPRATKPTTKGTQTGTVKNKDDRSTAAFLADQGTAALKSLGLL